MWGSVASIVVVVVAMMSSAGGSTARHVVDWCPETTVLNIRITKDMKPELALIPVVVNNTLEQDVVDEVVIRHHDPCEGITQAEVAHIDGEEAQLILQDGDISLFWRPSDTIPLFQEVDDFCITATRDSPEGPWTSFLAEFCFPIASLQMEEDKQNCSEMTCVRKCCPPRMSLAHGSMCAPVQDGEGWQPSVASIEPRQATTSVQMLYGPPRLCDSSLIYHDFSILPSGMLVMNGLTADFNSYCIDAFDDPSQAVALVCQETVTSRHCEWRYEVLTPVLLGISSVCLIIVWLVYISVAKLRSLNEGRCILCLVSALFVTFVNLIILNFHLPENWMCELIGRLCHFAVLASYFWMNVLSFHTFVQLRSQTDGKWDKPTVFLLYSLYAWGCPLVVVLVGWVLDTVSDDAVQPNIDIYCWFDDPSAKWAYLYGPMLLLLLVNTGFFVGCVVLLSRRRGRVTFTSSSSNHHTVSTPDGHGSVWLYVRLFILMGILWLTEVMSWSFFPYCTIPEWIFDVINSLQGVLVFLVTVCCRRDLKVFHCGCPQLIQQGRHGEVTSTTEETSEMVANPLVT